MISQNQFKTEMADVVTACLPTEAYAFQIAADDLIETIYAGRITSRKGKPKGEFGFFQEGKAILEFVVLLHATYKVVRDLAGIDTSKTGHLPSLDTFADLWTRSLTEGGIAADKATDIVRRFATRLYTSAGGGV